MSCLSLQMLCPNSSPFCLHRWNAYDVDGNGVMNKKELKKFADDCVERCISSMEEQIRAQNPHIDSQAELDEILREERMFILPGE